MTLHRKVQIVKTEALRQVQLGIERIDNQLVAVAAVGRRHAAVGRSLLDAEFAQHARPTVRALHIIRGGDAVVFRHRSTLQIRYQPMYPHKTAGGNGILVFQHHGKRLRALRRAADFKRNRISRHAVFTKLTAALAVLVGKFAVDDGGGGNLHGDSCIFGVKGMGILAGKGRLKTGFWFSDGLFSRF